MNDQLKDNIHHGIADRALGFKQPNERIQLERRARSFAIGEGRAIVESLVRYLSDTLGNDVAASDLRAHLRGVGLPPRDRLDDSSVAAAVESLQKQFFQAMVFPDNHVIPRSETQQIWELLHAIDGPRIILVHGRAGNGKSGVMRELACKLAESQTPFLPIRLDSQRPENSEAAYLEALGLPDHPARCLSSISHNKLSVLLIDQLDAVRWTAAHSDAAWTICREIIDIALGRATIRVVVACRTFDLNDDQRFRVWEQEKSSQSAANVLAKRLEVKSLSDKDVEEFVANHSGNYHQLSTRQRTLLESPLCLYLWWELRGDEQLPEHFSTASDLMQLFWQRRRSRLNVERGFSESDIAAWLDKVVNFLDTHGRQDFPAVLADEQPTLVQAALSLNLIQPSSRGVFRFAHQSYLDFLVAERVMRQWMCDARSPVEWLRSHDQSLFRREQLRQLMVLLREQYSEQYLMLLAQLFWDNDIRFHLRHLALGMLKSTEVPTYDEYLLLLRLLSDENWCEHALRNVVLGHEGWFEKCIIEGLFGDWLSSGETKKIEYSIWMFRWAPKSKRQLIDKAMVPHITSGDVEWARRFDATLPTEIGDDSDFAFEWRCARIRTGHLTANLYSFSKSGESSPTKVTRLIDAAIDHELNQVEELLRNGDEQTDLQFNERFERYPIDEIVEYVHRAGTEGWHRLLSCLKKSVPLTHQLRTMRIRKSRKQDPNCIFLPIGRLWKLHRRLQTLNSILARLLLQIGRESIKSGDASVLQDLETKELRSSRCVNRLNCKLRRCLPIQIADDVIDWLLHDRRRFAIRNRRSSSPQAYAPALIRHFAPTCSDAVFSKLEGAIVAYHTKDEKFSVQCQLEALKERGVLLSNEFGSSQYVLLAVMPLDRLSQRARSALQTWQGKFGDPSSLKHRPQGRSGLVHSSIPNDRKHLVSDRVWLQIISTGWATRRSLRRTDNRFAERSHRIFANDIELQTRLAPSRFARLAMRIPLSAPGEYFVGVLRGLDQTKEPDKFPEGLPEWQPAEFPEVQSVILRLLDSGITSTEIDQAICWIVRNRAENVWNLRITDYVASLCINGTTPAREPQELWDRQLSPWEGLRGIAVESLHQLISNHSGLAIRYLPDIVHSVHDEHASVRVSATGLCNGFLHWDADVGIQLFLSVCAHHDDRVLNGLYVPHFLSFVWDKYPVEISTIISRMIDSSVDEVVEIGAYWATAGHFAKEFYSEQAQICRTGSISQRTGFVRALVDLTGIESYRPIVIEKLALYFDDADSVVSDTAAHVFHRNPRLLELPEGSMLCELFAKSKGFERDPSDLMMPLENYCGSLIPHAVAIFAAVAKATQTMASAIRDISTLQARIAHALPNILLKLYQESDSRETRQLRSECLDAWDSLLASKIIGLETLDKMEV